MIVSLSFIRRFELPAATPEFYLADQEGRTIAFWDEVTEADELRQAFDKALEGD